MIPLSAIALDEFARRQALAREMVETRQRTSRQADALLTPWAAIARYFGADLPRAPCAADGSQLAWIDFYPPDTRADHALTQMANELRRATIALFTRHMDDPHADATTDRARSLRRLDDHLSMKANLGPIDTASIGGEEQRSAA